MFNREYHRRAARLALQRVGADCVPDQNTGFYRPAKRPDPRTPKRKAGAPEQLQLKFGDFLDSQPLSDVFPEAYE
jgi:hypothetical protein